MSPSAFNDSPWRWVVFSDGSSGHPLGHLGLLLLRIYAGVTIAQAGLEKFPLDEAFVQTVSNMGFPQPWLFAFAAATAEFAGGCLMVVGLLARPAALLAAVTLGVAAFGTYGHLPFFAVHPSRLYFWIFVALTLTGAGRISLDHLARNGRLPRVFIWLIPLLLVGYAGYRQWNPPPTEVEQPNIDVTTIQAVSLAGSFNNWKLGATPMQQDDGGVWRTEVTFAQSGPIEFKFATNQDWAMHVGASAEAKRGFPLQAPGMVGINSKPNSIEAYIPEPGTYEFTLDTDGFVFSLDLAEDALREDDQSN